MLNSKIQDVILPTYKSKIAQLELVRCSGRRQQPVSRGYSRAFHIVMPLSGCYVWRPGKSEYFVDTNHAVLASGDTEYTVSHPKGGDVSLSIHPARSVVEELLHGIQRPDDASFQSIAGMRPTKFGAKATGRFLARPTASLLPQLEVDERIIRFLADVLDNPFGTFTAGTPATQKLIRGTKEYLHEFGFEKMSLSDVADALGVSCAHLARVFQQAEGVPLYQYHLNLRLNAALQSLPACDDVTGLAFDLGFSSHSHFTAVFRSRFGFTPSQYRAEMRGFDLRTAADRSDAVVLGPVHNDTGSYVGLARPLCVARGGEPAI
jgi:AraC family transcriptional regulator